MASMAIASAVHAGFSCARPWTSPSVSVRPRRMVVVKAEAINPEIRKTEEKVVDSVVVTELSKAITPYCRFGSLFLITLFYSLILAFHVFDFGTIRITFHEMLYFIRVSVS